MIFFVISLNKRVSTIQAFYFVAKFGLVLIYILKVYRKKSSSFFLRKNIFNSLLVFSFEKHVLSQVLKTFSVENLETTPSTYLSKFSCEIYLSRITNVRSVQFVLYSIYFFVSFFFFSFSIGVFLDRH